ncbi:MAG: glycosyltransferase [Spirochaetales bacterium]|nr:glycosyltransferase [Spirochaetales bacterium]
MFPLPPAVLRVVHILLVLGSFYFFFLAASNIIWLRLSSRKPRRTSGKKISVLIPARNEEANIARCLDSLVDQTYENYEIIVLDDQSTDATWGIISDYAQRYPTLIRAVPGRPLPPQGWHGKPHAMQQLTDLATGDYFLCTDADTVHAPDSVAWAVTNLEWHRVDFVSGYVSQDLHSFGEAIIVPAMYIMTAVIMPIWLIAATRTPLLSFAIGQFIVVRREAYEAIGGYAAVSGQISDDIYLARKLRGAGFRTIFLDVQKQVACRMYDGYRASFNGIAKNVSDFMDRKMLSIASASLATLFFFLLPAALLVPYLLVGNPYTRLVAVSVILFQLTWACVLYDRGLKWYVPFLYPLVFVHVLLMMWRGYGQLTWGTGMVWKGRVVK